MNVTNKTLPLATSVSNFFPTLTMLKDQLYVTRTSMQRITLFDLQPFYKPAGFSDSDWGGSCDGRKSSTSFVFYPGEGAFTWFSKKQSIGTVFTCESEYITAACSVNHAIWLRSLFVFITNLLLP